MGQRSYHLSNVIFAVPYKDFDYYADIVNQRRDRVTEAIKEMIASQDVSEWYTLFALLCEYQSVLYHFENVLESITLGGEVDLENNRWLIDKDVASKLRVYFASEAICRRELSQYNLSFSSH